MRTGGSVRVVNRDLLAHRLTAAGAEVRRATPETLSQEVIGVIAEKGWHRLVSVRRNRVGHPSVLGDDPPLSGPELEELDAVITESALGVAETGEVLLDHSPGQGRPELTARRRPHVCVVERVVATKEEASDSAGPDATWIQPSSDLIVILVDTVDPQAR